MLEDFHVLPLSALRTHSVRRRDVQQDTHLEQLVSFEALQRWEVQGHVHQPQKEQRVFVLPGASRCI